ncbi:hypothetical protein FHR24_001291 [Wenyingzhuangia heitensis]|uniref:Uncharacterized protein n=1 Tax=Wenyingzhuangia heitensis TaxID=1487859 RepID=A0ABX0UCS0_9FLAO|nr:hypothetical protein [Wenyingzhuangia heitensis]NIJ44852.1 hypothetical protein [Wenyingzhuangia heitensis]
MKKIKNSLKVLKKQGVLLLLSVVFCNAANAKNSASDNFFTQETTVRNAVVASVKNKEVLYVSSLSDGVGCYTLEGKNLWSATIETPAVIFEIEAADIDDDGNDDLLAASANGTIYCWSSKGKLLWKFTPDHKVRFSEIAVVKNNNKLQIFAGGNDYKLYELDAKGKQVSTTKISGVVRKIEAGNFTSKNKQDIFLMTYSHDKFRWEFMGVLDSQSKKVLKEANYRNPKLKSLSKAMVTNISISDINKDELDDILFFGDISFVPLFTGLNSSFEVIAEYKATRKDNQRYGHSKGISLLPLRDEIMFQFGGIMYQLDLSGKLIEKFGTRYAKNDEIVFSDFAVASKSKELIAAGEVDGGSGIYKYDLTKNSWATISQKLQGTMEQVEGNLELLYKQILDFKMPSYQQKSNQDWVMVTSKKVDAKVNKIKGNNIQFVIQKSPKEGTDRSHMVAVMGKIALKKDKRGKYQDSREDIVNMARTYEKQGQPFTFWAGHGNDPFYIQIETLEQILEVAPTTCRGFVYAEMDNVDDPRVVHFVKEYIPRLAKAIRKHKKAKLYFRYKNTFWALTNKLPLWQELFFSKKYNDILAPASEDTSSRTQDINLSGRVGMFVAGYIDDFAMRLVDDNPTSWRPLSPGGQRSFSPYLRQGVMMAAYGAKHGVIIDNNFTKGAGLNILFGLMKSGALPMVKKEDILSIGSWHLIKEVDEHLIHTIDNHHSLKQYKPTDDQDLFSVTQMHWAGTNIPEHDYSKIALGVDYRWLNYMPLMPNGMVPIAPIEYAKELEKNNIPYSVSNGSKGFSNGKLISAKEYATEFKEIVAKGKLALPVEVKGASWSAIRIDKNHIRVILVDPGYIEPKDRNVTITFNGKKPTSAIDILSKEKIDIKGNTINTKVLAGSLKFIDLTY